MHSMCMVSKGGGGEQLTPPMLPDLLVTSWNQLANHCYPLHVKHAACTHDDMCLPYVQKLQIQRKSS